MYLGMDCFLFTILKLVSFNSRKISCATSLTISCPHFSLLSPFWTHRSWMLNCLESSNFVFFSFYCFIPHVPSFLLFVALPLKEFFYSLFTLCIDIFIWVVIFWISWSFFSFFACSFKNDILFLFYVIDFISFLRIYFFKSFLLVPSYICSYLIPFLKISILFLRLILNFRQQLFLGMTVVLLSLSYKHTHIQHTAMQRRILSVKYRNMKFYHMSKKD